MASLGLKEVAKLSAHLSKVSIVHILIPIHSEDCLFVLTTLKKREELIVHVSPGAREPVASDDNQFLTSRVADNHFGELTFGVANVVLGERCQRLLDADRRASLSAVPRLHSHELVTHSLGLLSHALDGVVGQLVFLDDNDVDLLMEESPAMGHQEPTLQFDTL